MEPYHSQNVPTAAIYNNLETFYSFLSCLDDPLVLEQRKFRGDRALFWLGPDKLVFCSKAIPGVERICEWYGYNGTRALAPASPGWKLCLDILNDHHLLHALVEHAGPGKTIQLVPYAATKELYLLARCLRERFGLNVLLPECPDEENLWVRDFLDSKAGFRQLAASWIKPNVSIPQGWVARDVEAAAQSIRWFHERGMDCIVKPDKGESGLGMQVFHRNGAFTDLTQQLDRCILMNGDVVIIEQYFQPLNTLSPSFEGFVPPRGQGDPYLTYVSNQHFEEVGRFSGVLISKSYQAASWYAPLVENGLRIAGRIQKMGYVGHFDVDTIVDLDGRLHLLEMNTRRTGGTYAHEFGVHMFGPRYLDEVTLLSVNKMMCPGITSQDELWSVLEPVLFPIYSEQRGLVITVTSGLATGSFSCLIAGRDIAEVHHLKREAEMLLGQRTAVIEY
jgi:hypothetical protein